MTCSERGQGECPANGVTGPDTLSLLAWRGRTSDNRHDRPVATSIDLRQLAQELVDKARTEGVELVGPRGLLTGLTKSVLETALKVERSTHLGYQSMASCPGGERAAVSGHDGWDEAAGVVDRFGHGDAGQWPSWSGPNDAIPFLDDRNLGRIGVERDVRHALVTAAVVDCSLAVTCGPTVASIESGAWRARARYAIDTCPGFWDGSIGVG